jgi:hypothetical protein
MQVSYLLGGRRPTCYRETDRQTWMGLSVVLEEHLKTMKEDISKYGGRLRLVIALLVALRTEALWQAMLPRW